MNNKTTLLALCAVTLAACAARADGTNTFKDEKEKISYAIGLNIGNGWKQQDIDADYDMLVRGIKDAKAGGALLLTE